MPRPENDSPELLPEEMKRPGNPGLFLTENDAQTSIMDVPRRTSITCSMARSLSMVW